MADRTGPDVSGSRLSASVVDPALRQRVLGDARVELEPHGIEDRERAGEAETEHPGEVPHAMFLRWRMSLSANGVHFAGTCALIGLPVGFEHLRRDLAVQHAI